MGWPKVQDHQVNYTGIYVSHIVPDFTNGDIVSSHTDHGLGWKVEGVTTYGLLQGSYWGNWYLSNNTNTVGIFLINPQTDVFHVREGVGSTY